MKTLILIILLIVQLVNCDINSTHPFNSSVDSSANINLTVSNINLINLNQEPKINSTTLNKNVNSTYLIDSPSDIKSNSKNLYIDLESTNDTFKLSTLSDLLSNEITSTESFTSSVISNISEKEIGDLLDIDNQTNNQTVDNLLNPKNEINSTIVPQNGTTSYFESSKNSSKIEINIIPNTSLDNSKNISTIDIYVTRNSTKNYAITKTEIKRSNQTLLSTIILRLHNFVQYSSNFSSQAVIPYVYLAKIQFDGLYRHVTESTYLHNYMSNIFNLIVNDLMNKECNVLSTMLNYLVIPIAETNGSNYVFQQTRELVDDVYRWHTAFQRWSSQLSSIFYQIAELRIEDCGQKLLCSLGKAKYRSLREEPRMNRSKIIQFLNNLFNMPILEKRLKRSYLEARQYGASGGNCDQVTTNCFMPTENFDNLINLAKQLF